MSLYKSTPAARGAADFARDAGLKDATAVKAYAEAKIAPQVKGLSDNDTARVTRAALEHMQAPTPSVEERDRAKAVAFDLVRSTQGIGGKRKAQALIQRANARLKAESPEVHAFLGTSAAGNDSRIVRAVIDQQLEIDAKAARSAARGGFKSKSEDAA